jgi:hypothetical protein
MRSLACALAAAAGIAALMTNVNLRDSRPTPSTRTSRRQRPRMARRKSDRSICATHRLRPAHNEAAAARKPGEPNPYVIGTDGVRRYLTVADECAKAGLLRLGA